MLHRHGSLSFDLTVPTVHDLIVLKVVGYLFLAISDACVLLGPALIKLVAINDSYFQVLALLFTVGRLSA